MNMITMVLKQDSRYMTAAFTNKYLFCSFERINGEDSFKVQL